MTLFSCSGVRRRLQAFYDRELSIPDQIAIESHVADCPPCASELRDIQGVGEFVDGKRVDLHRFVQLTRRAGEPR